MKGNLSKALISALLISFVPASASAAETKFPKKVTIKWKSSVNQTFYTPDGRFVVGKKMSEKVLDSEAKKFCIRSFGFTNVTVAGASGRTLGASNGKNTKFINSHKLISGAWILDEFGEDTYEIRYSCSGTMSVNVSSRSSKYGFVFENLQTKFTGIDSNWFSAGYFSLEQLEQYKWTLNAVFPENWRIADSAITFPEWTPQPSYENE